MNFTNLQYFMIVARELNITTAAKKIHISQQSLSQHIRNLEEELNAELFVRTPRLHLTQAGITLANAANRILGIRDAAINEIQAINDSAPARLRLGISYARAEKLLPHILPKFYAQNPNVVIDLMEGGADVTEPQLELGNLDLVLLVDPDYLHFKQIELVHEQLYIVMSYPLLYKFFGEQTDVLVAELQNNFDFTCLRGMPLIMLKKPSTVRKIFDEMLDRANVVPRIQVETKSVQTCLELAKTGIGATLYPDLFLDQHLVQNSYNNVLFFPVRSYGPLMLCYNAKFSLSNAARSFINCTSEWLRNQENPFDF